MSENPDFPSNPSDRPSRANPTGGRMRWAWWTPCGSFHHWLWGWWDSAPWRLKPPSEHRCYMGAPVADSVWCRRRAIPGSLFCKHCAPEPTQPVRD